MPEKILIVEDNLQSMKVMMMTLRPYGYALFQAADGEEALEVAVREKPDLIIMDIRIPKIDGIEVTRRLRQMPVFSHTPIIVVTAYAMKGDREKFIDAGCDAYIPKPINTRQLSRMVAEMLSNTKQNNI